MSAKNEFDKMIIAMSNELAALKVAKLKSASTLQTFSKIVDVTFICSQQDLFPTAEKAAYITAVISPSPSNALSQCYFMGDRAGRIYRIDRQIVSQGTIRFIAAPIDFTSQDYAIMQSGGKVTIGAQFEFVATSDAEITVTMGDNPYA